MSDAVFGHSRRGSHKLLRRASLQQCLIDPEFVEGLGRAHIKSKEAIHWAFRCAAGAGEATRNVHALLAAGAVNVFSSSALAALHAGVAAWAPGADARLLAGIVAELDDAGTAAMFLRLYLEHPRCAYRADAARGVDMLRGVVLSPDCVELLSARSGAAGSFLDELGEPWASQAGVLAAVKAAAAGDADDSSADEEGNLAGFVVAGDGESDLGDSDFERDSERSSTVDGAVDDDGCDDDDDDNGDDDAAADDDGDDGAGLAGARAAARERVPAAAATMRKRRRGATAHVVEDSESSDGHGGESDGCRAVGCGGIKAGTPHRNRKRASGRNGDSDSIDRRSDRDKNDDGRDRDRLSAVSAAKRRRLSNGGGAAGSGNVKNRRRVVAARTAPRLRAAARYVEDEAGMGADSGSGSGSGSDDSDR